MSDRLTIGLKATEVAAFLLAAWGALLFGAVYPWGYVPLLTGAVVVGAAGWFQTRRLTIPGTKVMAVALALPVVGILLQLLPLPRWLIAAISPATDTVLQTYSLSYATGIPSGAAVWHSLSINPGKTWLGLAFVAAFAVLLIGLGRLFSVVGAPRTCGRILALGLVLALEGIIQRSSGTDLPYGLWHPQEMGRTFGPFFNKNHFAGWMLMALGVGTGCMLSLAFAPWPPSRPGWRDKILRLSLPHTGRLIVLVVTLGVMSLSLVMTMSRAALASFVVTLLCVSLVVVYRSSASAWRKLAAVTSAFLLLLLPIAWWGSDRTLGHFADARWGDLGRRLDVWRDTWHIVRDFTLTGTGFNTYGIASLFYGSLESELHFTQAQNDYLQLAAEGGMLLTVPVLAAICTFAAVVRHRFQEDRDSTIRALRLGAVTGLIGIALQDTLDFSLQIPGNAVLAVVLAAVAIHVPPQAIRRRASGSFPGDPVIR